ncbi:hypothetical protein [Curtobacterium ammoniigenes]|uniref:hypothetical protein n=1 Tax=Curtobacterium ammoniigenes TaxID=395387 RepID=UPI000ACB0593|nr:hypothetical protein [Curtobacterium ammoniigenes]
MTSIEVDVAAQPHLAEDAMIAQTPTTVVQREDGEEVFRAAGAPRLPQLLAALALAVPGRSAPPASDPP